MATLQITKFRLKPDVSETDFRVINQRFQLEAVPKLSGMLRRETGCSAEGEWSLVVRWKDLDSARQASRIDVGEIGPRVMGHIDMSTMSVGFYDVATDDIIG